MGVLIVELNVLDINFEFVFFHNYSHYKLTGGGGGGGGGGGAECGDDKWYCVLARIFLRVSQIRKFDITQIYACRTLANPEGIAIYRLTRYRYFAHVLSAYAFRNLRYFIQTIATDHAIL